MKNVNHFFFNPRPILLVESGGGAGLGNCYSASYTKVTSTRKLSVTELRNIPGMPCGQEFYAWQIINNDRVKVPADVKWDTVVAPSGMDEVQPTTVCRATGKVLDIPAINPYSGQPVKPMTAPYYVYHCETRVDSSD